MSSDSKDNKMIILSILKNSSDRVSGEELSRITSISRVGVWKHINSLKEHGYEIDSNRSGYILKQEKDILQKWEFPRYINSIEIFSDIDSTMKKAKKQALEGAEDRTIIAAEKQTEGKDRKGGQWISEEGGLYFTVILRPDLPLSCWNLLTLASSAGIKKYLESLGINSRCRWPNDILAENRKIAGILTEVSGLPGRIEYALLGIGININNTSSGISLKEIFHRDFPRKKALNDILENIFETIDCGYENIPHLWESSSAHKDEELSFKVNNRIIEGYFKSVTREGNLLLKTRDGNETVIIPGDREIHNQTN